MAKKFGKVLMMTAALGAVAAGAYYYLKSKDALVDDDFDDDDFDDDLDEEGAAKEAERNYVDLDLQKADEFKEGISAEKADVSEKVVGCAKEAAQKVEEKAEEKVEEFFDDDDNDGSMDAM